LVGINPVEGVADTALVPDFKRPGAGCNNPDLNFWMQFSQCSTTSRHRKPMQRAAAAACTHNKPRVLLYALRYKLQMLWISLSCYCMRPENCHSPALAYLSLKNGNGLANRPSLLLLRLP
jgi:hypothetical protein